MRRLLIGLAGFVLTAALVILIVPFLLPRDEIKKQVIAQVEDRFGWQLRLDGPVSLSLLPGFSLGAEEIGLSGEAGADGIEFAKADRLSVGLAWSGLLSGNVQITGIGLTGPQILLETAPDGTTSWQPRRIFTPTGEPAPAAPSPSALPETTPAPSNSGADYLARIGVDRVEITDGTLRYRNMIEGGDYTVEALNMVLRAPDLAGEAELEGSLTFDGKPLSVSAWIDGPLAFTSGDTVPIRLTIASGETSLSAEGNAGLQPPRGKLDISAESPSLGDLAALADIQIPEGTGALSLQSKLSASEAAVSVADLKASLGAMELDGAADADLSGLVPEVSGRIVLQNGSIKDLLALAGQDLPASGLLGADLAFETVGLTTSELISGLDVRGSVAVSGGEVGGLGLASSVGDPEADTIRDLSLKVDVRGLTQPIDLSGALSWRGEGFSIAGNADTAALLAGSSAPVSVTLKGNRLSAGFDGSAKADGRIDGAMRVETADLRGLMAWMGQPIGAGLGLKSFKASGIFAASEKGITFEETRFSLDQTSGEANGSVDLSGKPKVTANLNLRELVLDPYLGSSGTVSGSAGGSQGAPSTGGNQSVGGNSAPSGWSTKAIDFSGLQAVNARFKVTSEAIRWDKIRIGNSELSATIQDGVLTADLERLSLYGGNGKGGIVLNGGNTVPTLSARFSMSDLEAYPLLRDAAGFERLEGSAAINLALETSGSSERALVEGLNGTADYQFTDGAVRGINIPKMVRGLSVETLLGWQENAAEKTDFSSLSASFQIQNGVAQSSDLSMIGPLVRMSGAGRTDLPAKSLAWRVEPMIVPTLQGQAPQPRRKGEDKKMAGLGVPIVIDGPWDNPRIYPDIAGILNNPEAAYKQLEQVGGELVSILKGRQNAPEALADQASNILERATGGQSRIDVQKVIEGDVDDQDVLKAVEEGFGLPSGLLDVFGGNRN